MNVPGKAALHAVACTMGLSLPHSQTSQIERDCLIRYASDKKRAVEIGVHEGLTCSLIGRAVSLSNGILYAIDPFLKGRLGISWYKLIAKNFIKKNGLQKTVRFVELYSDAACKILSGDFDYIFIDGDHSYKGIQKDWQDWAPRVVESGILALHDTGISKRDPGIVPPGSYHFFEAVIKNDKRFKILEQVGSLSILRRL